MASGVHEESNVFVSALVNKKQSEFVVVLQEIPNESMVVIGIYCNYAENSE